MERREVEKGHDVKGSGYYTMCGSVERIMNVEKGFGVNKIC